MGAILTRIDDPRDNLEKATRDELTDFAVANGVSEIDPNMPAIVMRKILRQKGVTNISIPQRQLGGYQGKSIVSDYEPGTDQVETSSVDADDDLAKQWQKQKDDTVDPNTMKFQELRRECKNRGIKFSRSDNMTELRAKLSG